MPRLASVYLFTAIFFPPSTCQRKSSLPLHSSLGRQVRKRLSSINKSCDTHCDSSGCSSESTRALYCTPSHFVDVCDLCCYCTYASVLPICVMMTWICEQSCLALFGFFSSIFFGHVSSQAGVQSSSDGSLDSVLSKRKTDWKKMLVTNPLTRAGSTQLRPWKLLLLRKVAVLVVVLLLKGHIFSSNDCVQHQPHKQSTCSDCGEVC